MVLKKKYRILQVFSNLGVGGAEIWLMALLNYFEQTKHKLPFELQIDILLTGKGMGVFDKEAILLGAKIYYLDYRRGNLINFISKFRSILTNGNYDAIHDHQDYTAGLHFLFGIGHLPPVRISHIHNPLIHMQSYCTSQLRVITAKTGKYLLAHLATHVIGTSRRVVSDYGFDNKYFKKVKRSAVYCGFDSTRFIGNYENSHNEICKEFGWEQSVKILLFVGRLNSNLNQKNPEFAIEIAKNCIAVDSGVRLLVAGSGDDVKMILQSKINNWGLEKKIQLIGSRTDIPKLMIGSNLLLFPSVGEGLGMVAVEAQSAGLRVLASDCVPVECKVVPNMVFFKSLGDGVLSWAEEALKIINLSRADLYKCNSIVEKSPFSIQNSATSLQYIYTQTDKN